jgi:hypothetical protein
MDLAPTYLELAGASCPATEGIRPMLGESLVDYLAGRKVAPHDDNYVTVHAHRVACCCARATGSWSTWNRF